MGRFVDTLITYRILRKLVTPFEETDAYKLGVIDAHGVQIVKDRDMNTPQREAYTILDRMIFRLKKIIHKVPADNRRISSFANALSLVREHANDKTEYVFLEQDFIKREATAEDLQEVADFMSGRTMKTFKMFHEDGSIVNAVGAGFSGQATPNPNPNLAGRDIILGYGKPVRRTNPTLKAKKIRTEEYKRPARYPDGKLIPEDLPDLYQPASNSSVPKNQRCDNCEYYVVKTEKCTRWNNAVVKPAYWCAKWDKK